MSDEVAATNVNDQAPSGDARLDSRAEAMIERFRTERVAAAKAEPEEGEAPKAAPATQAPAAAAPPDDQKLAKLLEAERDLQKRRAELQRKEKSLEGVDERIKKAEALEKMWAKADEDPERILEILETKVGAEKLTEWFGRMTDPGYRAMLAAKRAADEHRADLSPFEKRLEEIERRQKAADAAEARGKVQNDMSGLIKANAGEVPFAHRMLERKPDKFWNTVDRKVQYLSAPKEEGGLGLAFGTDYNMSDVVLQIEQDLKDDFESLAEEKAAAANTGNGTQTPTSPAAAKATTLSNREASTRTTLQTERPGRRSHEDKIRELERQARRMT